MSKLKFLIDNNVPKSVGEFLIKNKHEIVLVNKIKKEMTDLQIINYAKHQKLIILTNDKDFLYLGINNHQSDIIIFNFYNQKAEVRINALKQVINSLNPPFGVLILEQTNNP